MRVFGFFSIVLTLTLGLLGGVPARADQPASQGKADAPTPSSQEYTVLEQRGDRVVATLPNRMIVIAQRVPTAPVVSAQVWIKTGSIYEQEHVGAGLSHYLEHLLSGGSTTNRTEAQSTAILGRIGASTNAATGLDTVRYHINTTADHAETAIDLLSDWMRNARITPTEFKRERDVILREFSMGRGDPGRIFWKLTQQARYTAHPAMHPTIGYEDEFKQITREEIVDFYHRMYVPNNMAFVVVGDIDPQQTVQQIAERWSDAEAKPLPELSFPVEPEMTQPKDATGYADVQRPRLRLAWPGTKLGEKHDYAMDLLAVILGQGESSRLSRTVRDEQGLVSSVNAYNLSFPWGKGFFGVDAEVAPSADGIDAVKSAILEQVEKLKTDGVTGDELARAKREVMSSVVQANQTVQGIANRVASDTVGMGDPDYLRKYADAVQSLTADQIKSAADDLLVDSHLITVRLLPQTEQHPMTDMARPEGMGEKAKGQPTREVRLDNRGLIDQMRAMYAEAGDADENQAVRVDDPVWFTLDNGLRVIVQRSTVVPAVAMQVYSLGGLLDEPEKQPGISNAMASMLTRGTQAMSADELNRTVESLGASLTAGSGNNTVYVRATALKNDWEKIFGIMADVIERPTFPEDQWARLQPRLLAAIARQGDTWYGELRQDFRQAYFGDHPWARTPLGDAEAVRSFTAHDLAEFHQTQFNADQSVLAIVGDVDPEHVREVVAKRFGQLDLGDKADFNPPLPGKPQARVVQAKTGKPVTAVQFGYGPGITRDSPDYPGLRVMGRLMSDFPSGYLEQALRGQGPGLVYAVSGGTVTGMVPGYFAIMFNTQADTAALAIERTRAVVDRLKTRAVSEADLARAKAKVLSTELLGKQSNADRAAMASLDELYGVSDPGAEQFMKNVKAVDADEVKRLADQYLVNPVVVVLSRETIDLDAGRAEPDSETPSAPTPTAADATP